MASIDQLHYRRYETDVLNEVESNRRKINWSNILTWTKKLGKNYKDKILDLFKIDVDTVELEELTMPFRTFLYFLFLLAKNPDAFKAYFVDFYRERFDMQSAPPKPQNTVTSVDAVISALDEISINMQMCLSSILSEKMNAEALVKLALCLTNVLNGCANFEIILGSQLPSLAKNLNVDYMSRPNLAAMISIDVGRIRAELVAFRSELEADIEAYQRYEQSKGRKITTRPLHPSQVTIMILEEIHQKELGNAPKDAAIEFAHLCIASTDNAKLVSESWYKGDDLSAHLQQFPFVKALAGKKHFTEHDVEHALGKIAPEDIAMLIAYLRLTISAKRPESIRQTKTSDVPRVQELLYHLEGLLAKGMATALTDGDATKAAERAPRVTKITLYDQLKKIEDNPEAATSHLKSVKPVHEEKEGGGILDGFSKIGPMAADIAAVIHFVLDMTDRVRGRKKASNEGDNKAGKIAAGK